jgi:hypothetical protein
VFGFENNQKIVLQIFDLALPLHVLIFVNSIKDGKNALISKGELKF